MIQRRSIAPAGESIAAPRRASSRSRTLEKLIFARRSIPLAFAAALLATDKEGYQTPLSQYLKSAARRQLEARGLRHDEAAPQLMVNFGAKLNEKLKVSQTSSPTMGMSVGMGGGYYGYRGGLYSSWPLYANETQVSSYQ